MNGLFTGDVYFQSTSTAAACVIGGPVNGKNVAISRR